MSDALVLASFRAMTTWAAAALAVVWAPPASREAVLALSKAELEVTLALLAVRFAVLAHDPTRFA